MRLKFLFFPISLVIAASVFFGFILPQFTIVQQSSLEKNSKTQELMDIGNKQAIIESLASKLEGGGEAEKNVKDYLPESKASERAINNINFLANDANVSLVDISLGDVIGSAAVAPAPAPAIDPTLAADQAVADVVNKLNYLSIKISIGGDYEKIRIFLNNLEHMPMFNEISSLNISKQEAIEKDGIKTENNVLKAELVVKFGFMKVSSVGNTNLATFDPKLDEKTIEAFRSYIAVKAQPSLDNDSIKGKQNPFFPN